MDRTHMCTELNAKNIGEKVVVYGWVHRRRDHGGLIFIDLRDRTGLLQVVFNPEHDADSHRNAHTLRTEYVLKIEGEVISRGEKDINPAMKTGEIEIAVNKLIILNKSLTPPIMIDEKSSDAVNVSEDIKLKYRYLDLRKISVQKNILMRHQITSTIREYFNSNGFLDIETPFLAKSTPEGARDYLVPSRTNSGKFFALPQSPQLFKQILMVSGYDRYYQIVKCFRDEDLRADRQPEFTQIDVEMSFIEQKDIFDIIEGMLKTVFKEVKDIDIKVPFKKMTYDEAMDRYGCDKPDIRFGLELKNVSDIVKNSNFQVFKTVIENNGIVKGINVTGGSKFSRKDIDDLTKFAGIYGAKGMAWFKVTDKGLESSIKKFFPEETLTELQKIFEAEPGDLVLLVADNPRIVNDSLGNLRVHIAKTMNLIDNTKYEFLWIYDFPLVEYDAAEKRYYAMHHPFTSPDEETLEFLESSPEKVKAKAYDVVLNGTELGGGSIRIHKNDVQKKMFNLLNISEDEANAKFGFLLEALQYGAPPHGGIALGLDRLVMILADAESLREVIPFPKTQKAMCLMTGAPGEVSETQLKELNIKLI